MRAAQAKAAQAIDLDGRLCALDRRLVALLATATAVLRRIPRRRPDPTEDLADFPRRLADHLRRQRRLGRNEGGRLSRWDPDALDLRGLIELALAPLGVSEAAERPRNAPVALGGAREPSPSRVSLAGPTAPLPDAFLLPLGATLCELAAVALQHGALSVARGYVEVCWSVQPTDAPIAGPNDGKVAGALDGHAREGSHRALQPAARLHLAWLEHGGPPAEDPARRGQGLEWIEGRVGGTLRGVVRLAFLTEGVRCSIELPLPSTVRTARLRCSTSRHISDWTVPQMGRVERAPARDLNPDRAVGAA